MKPHRKVPIKVRKRLLERRTRIFTNWLKIKFERPYTIFLAAVLPFLQAFLASTMVVFTSRENTISANLSLFLVAAFYYFAFAMNSKRATKGSWLGLVFLIIFGALGILCGKILLS